MNAFASLLKREYWEHRGGFVWAPTVVSAAIAAMMAMALLVAYFHISSSDVSIMGLRLNEMRLNVAVPDTVRPEVVNGILVFHGGMAMLLQFVLGIMLFFYFVGSLFDERRDRSVLFWKSMPVSDLTTVLSKIVAGMLLAPLIALAVTAVFQIALTVIIGLFLSANGIHAWKLLLWQAAPYKTWFTLLAGIPINAVWALPTIGWLMLVSSWARGKPFLWAVLTPLVCGVLLWTFDAVSNLQIPDAWYWKEIFWRGLGSIFPWSFTPTGVFRFGMNITTGTQASELVSLQALLSVLGAFRTWAGIVIGVGLISASVYMRRYREMAD